MSRQDDLRNVRGKECRYAVQLFLVALVAILIAFAFVAYEEWCFQDDACLNDRIRHLQAAGKIKP
ncbi:hypothetical protein [Fimbriiglobus ruber]|uniref:hypothetical protein n=1 Tax=Fimbriiglobus ruber TaxID=1908690 RepID=UPI00117BCBDA|nr:hypothetical protein [Fimbriiglobus ruber]